MAQARILKQVAVPASAAQCVAVNPALNRIYVSGGASANQQVAEVSGVTYAITVLGPGSCASVDPETGNVWAAGVYEGSVLVYDGVTIELIRKVPLAGCPVGTGYDLQHARAWVGAQCGAGSDPTFAVNGRTYQVEAGPIRSGGVYWGSPIINPATGKAYFGATTNGPPMSLSIDPQSNFAQTLKPFGSVGAVDPVNSLLFAVPSGSGSQLQIVTDGPGPEPVVRSISLPFTANAGALAVNPALGRLYAANSSGNTIEVLNEKTGAPIETIALGAGNSAFRLAVDPKQHRVYALVQTASGTQLFVIRD
jgi:DNA-binding beta-propeller fold protein YncE